MTFKLRLYDETHADMETVWAEDADEPNLARLRNRPYMFPALSLGDLVRWEWDEDAGMRVCRRSDGVSGIEREMKIDAVWNRETEK